MVSEYRQAARRLTRVHRWLGGGRQSGFNRGDIQRYRLPVPFAIRYLLRLQKQIKGLGAGEDRNQLADRWNCPVHVRRVPQRDGRVTAVRRLLVSPYWTRPPVSDTQSRSLLRRGNI